MTIAAQPTRAPGLTIDGEIMGSNSMIDVVNPATGTPFISVPMVTSAQLERAIAAANKAAIGWRRTPFEKRQEYARALVRVVRENLDELGLLLTLEQGKPIAKAKGEIESGLRYIEALSAMPEPREIIKDDANETIEVRHVPIGVAAAITAWNYPMLLALWKIGPALVAGNPVIVKPASYTPVTTLRLGELLQSVFPPGIVQVVAGGGGVGAALTSHPGIHKVSFTGSTPTGRTIMAAAAPTLKRLTLELGGNDPGIVLADADPAAIADDLYWGGLSNAGQVCAGLKRLYVPESLAADITDALAEVAARVVVGDGTQDGVDMGPVQNKPQLDAVKQLVEDAEARGGDVYFRGRAPEGEGYFHPVTLVRGLTDDVPLAAEEQFGPALPILTYRDVDEVVARANAGEAGLGASVWGTDEDRAREVAEQLEAGSVWVNAHPILSPDTPFGGLKQSGLGVELSVHGLLAYTDISVLRTKHRASRTS